MASHKAGRMSEDIRRIISGKMADLKDPRINGGEFLTVVRCDVARDGSFCRVYISSFKGLEEAGRAVKGFESATGYLKREISNVLGLKKCPELKFVADDSIEHSAAITKKLRELVKDERPEDEEEAEDKNTEDAEDSED
ncbi:30S ribosome-binding factor RbfA [Ruminococcus sp.]|uniref:30S ribosome-binding factor RbfA n=1 Tax=Ruminococcus sp. TaxID=41978 RepID=UPI0025E421BE|nr:30S ribosome-binding factor RbfA [Ruminococcus sp.]MBQ8965582.1 30S ribosome-binding factor RbfA [Ruminococcus sp.]